MLFNDNSDFVEYFIRPLLTDGLRTIWEILRSYCDYSDPATYSLSPVVAPARLFDLKCEVTSLIGSNPLNPELDPNLNPDLISMSIIGFIVVAFILSVINKILLSMDLVRSGMLPMHHLIPLVIEQQLILRRVMLNANSRLAGRVARRAL